MVEASRKERTEAEAAFAASAYQEAMGLARSAWDSSALAACAEHLAVAAQHNPHSEALHRFRVLVASRAGDFDGALDGAGLAVLHGPATPRNHHLLAMACQRKHRLAEAGPAYMTALSRGLPGSSQQVGFLGYLNTVQRARQYYSEPRPTWRKLASGSTWLARAPARASIFDPDKTLEEGELAGDGGPVPEPPQLSLVSADEHSVNVQWYPDTSVEADGAPPVPIHLYELQCATFDVVWEGSDFDEGFRSFETVHRADASVLEAKVQGLRSDVKMLLRVRARGDYGYGEWNELVVSTLSAATKQAEALPLPRQWLLIDVADLVMLHVKEVGGDPKRFFKELASCFTPHVRKLRRLFFGWSRATAIGQKTKAGELQRQQFSRVCKEVGLCHDTGTEAMRMAKRSGAKLLSLNDVDRIFQRANIDSSHSPRGRRGSVADGSLKLDPRTIALLAEEAVAELSAIGAVESEPGEAALRDKLRKLFDDADTDRSGSVSMEEVSKMATSLGVEMSRAELTQLFAEADPDGSGGIDFEELVSALKKQIAASKASGKKGGGGVSKMAGLFDVEPEDEEDDGGVAAMVLNEFIHALVRVAWECYPTPNAGIGNRLNALLERAVLPGSSHILEFKDPMEAELSSKRVQAITAYYSDQLLDVFGVFAASDMSLNAQTHLESMSFAELVFMMKLSGLIDANLTVAKITEIFAQVNQQASDEGEKDEDADELSFAEFKSCLCRCANAKIPQEMRGDPPEPFEYTWQSFLQVLFLPKMRKVIKDMRKGLLKKTLA